MSIDALFHPHAVAVIGASTHAAKIGGVTLRVLRECGFAGEIFPINPMAPEIQGMRAWSSLRDLPRIPDAAIVAVPASMVEAAIEDCIATGVRAAIVFSSGFAEAGAEGQAAQDRMGRRARAAGLTLLGPNCLGVINVRSRWAATFSPAPLAGLPAAGNVALVSQSGAFGAYALVLARNAGIGLSRWVTTGNQASVAVADLIDWLADDDETKVIVAYIEGARDGRGLRQALLKARRAGKPVIVTKVGRTAAGAAAAMSHTASLSGEDALYQALIEETGAVRAYTIDEMFRLAEAFSLMPVPTGKRLGVITVSGGVGTMLADTASDEGLSLPALPQHLADDLRQKVAFCSTTNPVDVTGQFTSDYEGVLNATALGAARSGAYDALVLFLAASATTPTLGGKVVETFRLLRAAAPELPLVLTGILLPEQIQALHALGCLTYEEPTQAVETIAKMQRWGEAQIAGSVGPDRQCDEHLSLAATLDAGTYNEYEGLAFLERAGVPSAPHRLAQSADDSVAAWRAFDQAPVVLKIVSRDILHKSDVGGVRVGLQGDIEIREAHAAIMAEVAKRAPTARCEGILVARQLRPQLELILGARHDSQFGTVVLLGLGGVAVELNPRTALLFAPCTEHRVRNQLEKLGVLQLLAGWRGRPVIDPAPLIALVVHFSHLALRLGSTLRSMEVNPLMITAEGVFAADAVIEMAAASAARDGSAIG